MTSAKAVQECVQTLLKDFRRYDSNVDLVSCWQFFFTEVEPFNSNSNFDRFPKLDSSVHADDPKTPDFAVLISNAYGLIGDLKQSFPRDEEAFLKHALRLKKYDRPLAFNTARQGVIVPRAHDIMVLLPMRDAQEIVTRWKRKSAELLFERRVILFEWFYDGSPSEYVIRRVANQVTDFDDTMLPPELRLSKIFTERAVSLKVKPDHFKRLKAIWQFCNDSPPPIYTIVFLWTKIFYHFLDSQQQLTWRKRDPQKQMSLNINVQRLVSEIQRRYPIGWGHWTDWAKNALETLVSAGLARKLGDDRYEVRYRNLTREVGEPGQSHAGLEPRDHPTEFAGILARYICQGEQANSLSPKDNGDARQQHELFPNAK